MNYVYLSTLATVAGAVISITGTLLAGYLVYLRQRQDDYKLDIRRNLHELDRLIFQFSQLEELKRPVSWRSQLPSGYEFSIALKESWEETPKGIFEEDIKNLEDEFEKALKEDYDISTKINTKNPARSALYNKVRFAVHHLFLKIYHEFPAPPATPGFRGKIGGFKSFIDCDFPLNIDDFEEWAKKYHMFYREVMVNVYYRIRRIIYHLAEVNRESAENIDESLKMLQQLGQLSQFHIDSMKETKELYLGEAEFYDLFFSYLTLIEQKTLEIQDKIRLYNTYRLGAKCKYTKYGIVIGYIIMTIFGLVVPLYLLSPFQKIGLMDMDTTSIITGVLFVIGTVIAGLSIYQDVSHDCVLT